MLEEEKTLSWKEKAETKFKGVSALEPDSIHIDITLQSTSYETRSIYLDHVRTSCTLFVNMIARTFSNKSSRSADMFWLLYYLLLHLNEKKKRQNCLARERLITRRAGRRPKPLADLSEKVVKVRIVVSINMCSGQDSVYCHTSNNVFVSSTLQGPLDIFYSRVLPTYQIVTW